MPLVNHSPTPYDPYRAAFAASHHARYEERQRNAALYAPLLSNANPWTEFNWLRNTLCSARRDYEWFQEHPAVKQALYDFGRPVNWHLLALEVPMKAVDGVRVAYARTDAKRTAYFQNYEHKHLTATTVGKYLTRHWPHISSDRIRDLAESLEFKFEMLEDLDAMVDAVRNCVAYSCMKDGTREAHPYEAYDPKYGWKLAIGRNGGEIVCRALVLDDGKNKCFVRTYGRENSESTQSHPGLHYWLEQQGFEYEDEWPEGAKFAFIPYKGEHLAPYLDPGGDRRRSDDSQRVRVVDGSYIVRDDDGDYKWDNTDGTPECLDDEDKSTCDDCGARDRTDDMYWVGRHGDRCVCDSCIEDYTEVKGVNGEYYYVPDNQAVEVDGTHYDRDYLSENDIVELYNGDYAKHDDTVYVDCEDEYYPSHEVAANPNERGLVVSLEDGRGEYALREDAEWCEYNQHWIESDDAVEIADGKFVHADDHCEYLMLLPRDEVEANLGDEDLDEMLAKWDETNGGSTGQALQPENLGEVTC